MIRRIFYSQAKTITFAAFILGMSALISRILGLIRDRLLAGRFGAGPELDIYFAAFRIPDFVYGILIAGGVTAAFLPVFAEYFEKKQKERQKTEWPDQALNLANNTLNLFLFLLVFVCGILAIFTPFIVKFVIPGFSSDHRALTIILTRIMFLSPILFGLSSIFSGILHYFNRFLSYSLAPILYNLGIIFGILFLVPVFGVFGLVYGVIIGAFCHLLIQIPAARISGYRYKLIFNFKNPGIKKIFKLMLPRTLGSAAYQVNLIVVTAIASTLMAGSISVFNFSNNLHYFPIGLIGISFAVSSFPAFSRSWANGEKGKFLEGFSSSFRQIVFLITPVSLLIFLLRAQIVRLVLGTGRFGWLETRLTAACLGLFCLGILAESVVPLLSKTFFALQDTKTPVLISIFSMILNIIFSFLFVGFLKHPNFFSNFLIDSLKLRGIQYIEILGLPLALSLAALIQAVLLLIFLRRKVGRLKMKQTALSGVKILIAGFLMFLATYFIRQISAGLVDMSTFWGVFSQTIFSAGAGLLVYLLAVFFLKSPELKTIKSAFLK
jgi:putative peptidoglycan lipid II flippase